ncbi:dehydrogenase [Salinisphaera orenii MK-B5]|uniref:Dehydrogenase n=1 Tax=Salinisphaera orenii MK-B5 TaxID=856730 RepID=A0A423PPV0_9GAMM|nr:glucose 1-dehydrogenase [Salinisphaera orenii]ROO27613.1 dehydrogenase [Salinisphaera orenii MK-B5]
MGNSGSLFSLRDKVVLVTGGGRGLGAAMGKLFADAGAEVMLSDVLAKEGEEIAKEICDMGGTAKFVHHDVTVEPEWESAIAATVRAFGRVDILVNNAGIEHMVLASEESVSAFRRLMEVNVTGVFLGCKHAIRAMSPDGASGHGGSIINMSSIAGKVGMPAVTAYCASKGAVSLMTKSLAVECGLLKNGIRVNSIHPGVVWTDMGSALPEQLVNVGLAPNPEAARHMFLSGHPIGRFGSVPDVASAALYLASDAASWMTGSEFVVDGGYTAQ